MPAAAGFYGGPRRTACSMEESVALVRNSGR